MFSRNSSKNLHIVLVRPQYPVNIGLIVRTMKNFDINNLRLVKPQCNIFSEMSLRLSHKSRDILSDSIIFNDLKSALSDINIVFSATARKRNITIPFILPEKVPALLSGFSRDDKIAILFGNEETGMTNNELNFSNYCVRIPTSKAHPALNIAQSVSIILYEIFKSGIKYQDKKSCSADISELESLFDHMEITYSKLDFFKEKDHTRMMNIIKGIYRKALLSSSDVQILRGILSKTDYILKKR